MSPDSDGGGGGGGARAQIWESFSGGAWSSVGGVADGCPSVRTGHRDGGRAGGLTELPSGKSQVGVVGVCPGAVQGGCSGRSGSVAPSLGVGAGRIDALVAGGPSSSRFSRSGDSESLSASQAWDVGSGVVLVASAAGAELGVVGSSGATVVGRTAGPTGGGLPGSGDFRSKWISGVSVAGDLAAARACSHASGDVSNFFRAPAEEIRKRVAVNLARNSAPNFCTPSVCLYVPLCMKTDFAGLVYVNRSEAWCRPSVTILVDAIGRTTAGGLVLYRAAAVEISLPESVVHLDEYPHALFGVAMVGAGHGGGPAATGAGSGRCATDLVMNAHVERPSGARSSAAETSAALDHNNACDLPRISSGVVEVDWALSGTMCGRAVLFGPWAAVTRASARRGMRLAQGGGDASPRPD